MGDLIPFDRYVICAAYAAIEADYNVGGILRERPSNQRRRESTGVQLRRIGWAQATPAPGFGTDAKALYEILEVRYGFKVECTCGVRLGAVDMPSHLSGRPHHAALYCEALLESGWAKWGGTDPETDRSASFGSAALGAISARSNRKHLHDAGFPIFALQTAQLRTGNGDDRTEFWTRRWMLDLIYEARASNVSRKQIAKLIHVWARRHQDPVRDPPPIPEILRVSWP